MMDLWDGTHGYVWMSFHSSGEKQQAAQKAKHYQWSAPVCSDFPHNYGGLICPRGLLWLWTGHFGPHISEEKKTPLTHGSVERKPFEPAVSPLSHSESSLQWAGGRVRAWGGGEDTNKTPSVEQKHNIFRFERKVFSPPLISATSRRLWGIWASLLTDSRGN